ncbi:sugar nucleotide-binding protein [Candidatus Pacearchaeota archaeon]|nr:sugar nucleotide-binding protein [Candidatus Pacearchaeota archaeon]
MNERTEIMIGANGKIAGEYLDYLELKGIPSVAVYPTGDGENFRKYSCVKSAIKQDLRDNNLGELEQAIMSEKNPRIIYLAVEKRMSGDISFNDHFVVNALPVKKLADLISERKIPLLYASSDMVLAGNKGDFSENSVPEEPFGKYGISKFIGEQHALNYPYGKVIRLGNVLGTKGDFLSFVVKTIKEGGNPKVWTNVYNRFTGINEVCMVFNKLANYSGKQKVFHVASNNQPMSREEISERTLDLLVDRGIIPKDSFKKLCKVEHDFRDGRPRVLSLNTDITSHELGYRPTSIMCSILEKIDERESDYLRF